MAETRKGPRPADPPAEVPPAPAPSPPPAPTAATDNEVLELYKMAVEMADRVSARRGLANTFFLTINSALLAVVGLVPPAESAKSPATGTSDRFGIVILAIAGLVLSLTWWVNLRSYRQLNEAKFAFINATEERLAAKPYTDEWEFLTKKKKQQQEQSARPWQRYFHQYFELGQAERIVPLVYATIYIVAGIRALFA